MSTNTMNLDPKTRKAIMLVDRLAGVQISLEKVEYILQEVRENYFGKYNPETKEGRFALAWEYNRHGIFVEIITDYLYDIKGELRKELEALREELNLKRGEING